MSLASDLLEVGFGFVSGFTSDSLWLRADQVCIIRERGIPGGEDVALFASRATSSRGPE